MDKIKSALIWFFKSFIWLGVLLLVIDIVTKNVIVANKDYILSLPNSRIELIPNFLAISYVINTNAAFGIGLGNSLVNRIVYIVLAVLVSAILITLYVKKYKKLRKLYKACLMLILVGALGNVIDRVFFTPEYLGALEVGVVDWIDFYGIWRYVFNIADSAIVIGVIMLVVVLLIEEIADRRAQAKLEKPLQVKEDAPEAKEDASASEEAPLEEENNEQK